MTPVMRYSPGSHGWPAFIHGSPAPHVCPYASHSAHQMSPAIRSTATAARAAAPIRSLRRPAGHRWAASTTAAANRKSEIAWTQSSTMPASTRKYGPKTLYESGTICTPSCTMAPAMSSQTGHGITDGSDAPLWLAVCSTIVGALSEPESDRIM